MSLHLREKNLKNFLQFVDPISKQKQVHSVAFYPRCLIRLLVVIIRHRLVRTVRIHLRQQ